MINKLEEVVELLISLIAITILYVSLIICYIRYSIFK